MIDDGKLESALIEHSASARYSPAVTIILNTDAAASLSHEDPAHAIDQCIEPGDYFGTTYDQTGRVWRFSGHRAYRIGVPNPDYRSAVDLVVGETLRDALKRVPMFEKREFVLHKMELPPGSFYHRMARPSDQHPHEAPGQLPDVFRYGEELISTLNQLRSLVGMLDQIFQAVHPAPDNMTAYGAAIRNLLILACTECEAQWRAVIFANGLRRRRPSTNDYVKLAKAMRLNDYGIRFTHFPALGVLRPYATWNESAPTESLNWYDSYNAAKHDRSGQFHRASLQAAVNAVAAIWIMIAAQYGSEGIRKLDDLRRYFQITIGPRWRYSEVYTEPYPVADVVLQGRNYPL